MSDLYTRVDFYLELLSLMCLCCVSDSCYDELCTSRVFKGVAHAGSILCAEIVP
jgi:hypothetical protein